MDRGNVGGDARKGQCGVRERNGNVREGDPEERFAKFQAQKYIYTECGCSERGKKVLRVCLNLNLVS